MTVWVEKVHDINGDFYAISTEYHDGICYKADTVSEAVKMYEEDRGVKVTDVIEFSS